MKTNTKNATTVSDKPATDKNLKNKHATEHADKQEHANTHMQNKKYPTEWMGGKMAGCIKTTPNAYILTLTINKQQTSQYFTFSKYETKKHAMEDLLRVQKKANYDANVVKNPYRYISKDVIEIKTSRGEVIKTNSKFIDIVEKYFLNIKDKKFDDGTKRSYVNAQITKKCQPFTNLICDYKNVRYRNNNTFDLRIENLYDFGAISSDATKIILQPENNNERQHITKIANKRDIDKVEYYDFADQYRYFEILENTKEFNCVTLLPKNKWILGIPAGTIFRRKNNKNVYYVVVKDNNNKKHTRTVDVQKYNNDHKLTRQIARNEQIEMSYKLGTTRNLIRILDNYIEVKVDNSHIMKTDKIFVRLLCKYLLFNLVGTNKIIYCGFSKNNTNIRYHRYIMNCNTDDYIIDHINGDTFDNRLCNLRYANYCVNNLNKHNTMTRYRLTDNYVRNCVRIDNKYYTYNIKFENDNQKKFALSEAQNFNNKIKLVCEYNLLCLDKLNPVLDSQLIKFMKIIVGKFSKFTLDSICPRDIYISNFNDIQYSKFQLNMMYRQYLASRLNQYAIVSKINNHLAKL